MDQVKAAQFVSIKSCEPLVARMVSASTPWWHSTQRQQSEVWKVDLPTWRDMPPSPTVEDAQQDWCLMFHKGIYNDLFFTLFIKDDGEPQNLLKIVPFYWPLTRALERPPKVFRKGVAACVLEAVGSAHRGLRSIMGLLSPIPCACGVTSEDIGWFYPVDTGTTPVKKKAKRAINPDGLTEATETEDIAELDFGDLSDVSRQIVRHMQKSKAWTDFRTAFFQTHGVDKIWAPKLEKQIKYLHDLMALRDDERAYMGG